MPSATATAGPFPQALARPAQPLLMTKLSYRDAGRARARTSGPTPSRAAERRALWRYAQTWSGDNETAWKTLRFNLTQGLNMSLSGMFNIGHDVGGFHGPTPERGAVLPLRGVLLAVAALRHEFLEGRRHRQPALDARERHPAGARGHDAALSADAVPLHTDVAGFPSQRAGGSPAVL